MLNDHFASSGQTQTVMTAFEHSQPQLVFNALDPATQGARLDA